MQIMVANVSPRTPLQLISIAPLLLYMFSGGNAFMYQPKQGQIWDPSLVYWNDSYYAVSMYSPKSNKAYSSGFLSRSSDGVHWEDVGPIAPSDPNCQWWKGFVLQRPDDSFVLNHGVYENGSNDALRVLTSTNLLNWTEVATSKPDPQWYKPTRWDHMYMKPDPKIKGAYIGFPVSEPLNTTKYATTWPGVQRSTDGVTWKASEPLDVRWGSVAPQGIEEGGIERLRLPDGTFRYFLIGGQGGGGGCYQMWAFVSDTDDIMGPYSPTPSRFRMSGGLGGWGTCYSFGALGVWVPPGSYGGPLISQYITPHGGSAGRYDVWMLPMRAPITAQMADGTPFLRLGYWEGNAALLGPEIVPPPNSTSGGINCASNNTNGFGVTWVAELDSAAHENGGYLIANLSASGNGAVGFAIESPGSTGDWTAIVLTVGASSDTDPTVSNATIVHIDTTGTPSIVDTAGAFECGGAKQSVKCGVSSVTAISPEAVHIARLFVRRGMFEIYVDELLVTSHVYSYKPNATGRVGLACSNAALVSFVNARVGRLTLT